MKNKFDLVQENKLDIIRLDVLLFKLNGFANINFHLSNKGYSLKLIQSLQKIAFKPRAKYREVQELADKYSKSSDSLRNMIYFIRHKQEPKSWKDMI